MTLAAGWHGLQQNERDIMPRIAAAKHAMLQSLHQKSVQGRGNSKRDAKSNNNGVSPYIHSKASYQTYAQQVARYGDWLAENYPRTTIDGAAAHVQEYIDTMRAENKSAWTQQTARAAIGKALGVSPTSLAQTDTRHAADITRGRSSTTHSAAAAAKYSDDMSICECIGVRHGKEAGQVTPDNCHWQGGHIASVSLVGKGGRPRDAVVLPGRGRDILETRCAAAKSGSSPLMGKMTGCNVHAARARYAARCYDKAIAEGRTSGRTYAPQDGSGKEYDTGALDYVNEQLGHGAGRYDVAVYNYLSYGGEID